MRLKTSSWLFKRWIALSTGQKSIQCITQLVSLILFRWIVIYPVDRAIQRLHNRGQTYVVKCRHAAWVNKPVIRHDRRNVEVIEEFSSTSATSFHVRRQVCSMLFAEWLRKWLDRSKSREKHSTMSRVFPAPLSYSIWCSSRFVRALRQTKA